MFLSVSPNILRRCFDYTLSTYDSRRSPYGSVSCKNDALCVYLQSVITESQLRAMHKYSLEEFSQSDARSKLDSLTNARSARPGPSR